MDPVPPASPLAMTEWPQDTLAALDASARKADVVNRMRACLDDLDDLGLWKAGAYLDQAIHALAAKD